MVTTKHLTGFKIHSTTGFDDTAAQKKKKKKKKKPLYAFRAAVNVNKMVHADY
jgi:hypothetical protein